MYIKRYSVAAFILMALVGWYVYTYLTHDTMMIDLFGIPIPPLPKAFLVVVPLFVLYLASVMHMAFYSMLNNFKVRKTEKDYDNMLDSIVDAYLGRTDREHNYKTPTFTLFGELVDNSTITPNGNIILNTVDSKSQKIQSVLRAIDDIKRGEVAELKAYSLPIDNVLVIQNTANMYKKGDLSAEDILSHPNKYIKSLVTEVYVDYVKTATVSEIDKYKEFLSKEALFVIAGRVNADKNTLEITNEALITLFTSLELEMDDYMKITKITSASMIPDQRMKLFETLSNDKDEAMNAYLYTLLDLEMLSLAYDILDLSQPNEYQNFKAYRALRECDQHFSIELFI